MDTRPVFFDPSGRRKRLLGRAGTAIAIFLSACLTLFALSMLIIPLLPPIPGLSGARQHLSRTGLVPLPERQARLSRFLLKRSRSELWKEIEKAAPPLVRVPVPSGTGEKQVVAAFYATWQETGIHSLRANAAKLTHLMPEWLHLEPAGDDLNTRDFDPTLTPHNRDVLEIARSAALQIHPIFNNAEKSGFDPERVHRLLASPRMQQALAVKLRDWLLAQQFQGVNIDFENLYPQDYARVPRFLKLLGAVLHKAGLALSIDIEAGNERMPLREISEGCDFIVLMCYDEHFVRGDAGPLASIAWYYANLKRVLHVVPPSKLVIGLGNYAYDWTDGRTPATSLTYQNALILARDFRADEPPDKVIDFDPEYLNLTFEYQDDEGLPHEVWMLDAVTAYNQWLLARTARVKGAALWLLGSEDPSVWKFFDRRMIADPPPATALTKIQFPYEIEFDGQGEVLAVLSTPQDGERRLEVDPVNGRCDDEEYLKYPSSFVIRRSGYQPGLVALTFDDGPSPKYTPQILAELSRAGIHATFFVIGESAERYPDLLRQEWREGHEIGSHTFTHPNMGTISERWASLELNTTQRAIQGILHRSTVLFRPPYYADAEPTSGEEVKPLLIAAQLGYITVGEMLDPRDWDLWRPAADGRLMQRTPEDLAATILREVQNMPGNTVLLHDGGGDRTVTVGALRLIIPTLQRQGYRFVTISDLLGLPRDAVMPSLTQKDRMLIGFDAAIFETIFTFETLLGTVFLVAVVLGILKVFFVTTLAVVASRRARHQRIESDWRPPVSVLIAAYNERSVIVRTIGSVLDSNYSDLEVVVVDDGSTDGTADEVTSHFGHDPRVHLLHQENAGKAAALNRALGEARHDILVTLDADTQLAADALAALAPHFDDPTVAAVAGNVKVGNRINILTRWQAIEYIASQNLDRRAYALLNAVTVVPGAAGVWRREAVVGVGGYRRDTMAEDMDLTWRLRRAGWRIATESLAHGFTEAPDTVRGFFRQRFRWAHGTLQCLWKHRGALGRYGWFGRLALPALWLFQVFFQVLAPLVDVQMLYTLTRFVSMWVMRGVHRQDWQPLPYATANLIEVGFFYGLFFAVELAGAIIAFRLDRERLSQLWLLFWQRFVYRQLMWAVIWKSVVTALRGKRTSWGKLDRKGTVERGRAPHRWTTPAAPSVAPPLETPSAGN